MLTAVGENPLYMICNLYLEINLNVYRHELFIIPALLTFILIWRYLFDNFVQRYRNSIVEEEANIQTPLKHYDDVIMTTLASQITSLKIVYSIVYSGVDQRKHQSSASLAFVRGIHRFPAQRASYAENASI